MSGKGPGKHVFKGATVYIHEKGKSGAKITHIDVEHPELNKIIKDKEATFAAGKPGGFFIGLKKVMLERAGKFLKKKGSKGF
ncbi:MAG: hypothetical protein JSW08_00475 [archaeon]|nr:MAG: hypothetical protein JSW08_00475 [archaeon]